MTAPPTNNKANISIREYIYFLPYPLPPGTPIPYTTNLPDTNPLNLPPYPFEPTSTLVLTSSLGTFVDLRFLKPVRPGDPELPNTGGPRERLDWGFAGCSESYRIPDPSGSSGERNKDGKEEQTVAISEEGDQMPQVQQQRFKSISHSTWTHWIDSRYAVGAPNIPVDEGDMYTLSDELSLEHGHAFHPHLGAVKSHEELWKNVEIIPFARTFGAESGLAKNGKNICVVLRCENVAAKVRGVVVRLGQFCQGILMKDQYCAVERWEYDFEKATKAQKVDGGGAVHMGEGKGDAEELGNWKRTARIGDLFMPCAVTFKTEILTPGARVKYYDYEWIAEEFCEWE